MTEKLRFTGEWPTLKHWSKYPNWEYALDEEGEEGQDETTLRPANVQNYIAEFTAFTAGDAELADGGKLPALLEVSSTGKPDGVNVFIDDENAWRIYCSVPGKKWVAFIKDWLPESERGPEISLDDPNIFPLYVKSRLPRNLGGEPYHFVIYPDGGSEDLI